MISFHLSNRQLHIIGLGTLVILIAVMSFVGIYYLSQIEKELGEVVKQHRKDIQVIEVIFSEFIEIRGELTSNVIEEETDFTPLIKQIDGLTKKAESNVPEFHSNLKEIMEQFVQKLREYRVAMIAYSQELQSGTTGEGIRTWQRVLLETENATHTTVSDLKNLIGEEIEHHESNIFKTSKKAKLLSTILSITGILFGIAVAFLLQRALARPIRELVRVSKAIASGDLTGKVEIKSQDEIGQLGTAFNQMSAQLSDTLVSKDYLNTIIQSIADVLIVTNIEGIIKTVNETALKTFGYKEKEMIGSAVRGLCANGESDRISEDFFQQLLKEGNVTGYETTCKSRDGKKIPALLSGSVMKDDKGNLIDVVIIAKDITERKETEEALQDKNIELVKAHRDAEKANRFKSEFLANMSHEIRTPMNAVIGMTTLALDTPLNKEQQEYLNTVQGSAYALLGIINDILDFSKIEAGKLAVDKIDFNLRLTIEGVTDTLAHLASQKKLELACLVHHEVPSLLIGDPARIRQILINLGSNAVKFTNKGEVVIRAELLEETAETAKVLFSVADTGMGISEEKLNSIFDEFVQADGSTTRTHGGTGLGLSISKKLVQIMGGEVGVDSTVNEGSRFWFTVTFEKQVGVEEEAYHERVPDIKGMRVLVADDNLTNRKILVKMMESFGCRADSVPGGSEAVTALKEAQQNKDPYTLVLLDMMMPGMDGEHTTIIIKNTPQISKAAIIILTSLGNRGDVAHLRSLGCDGYLTKPVKQSLLLDTINTVVFEKEKHKDKKHAEMVTRHSLFEKKMQNIHILVVEDNPVNQKRALTMLRKAGYIVDAVENGKLAVDTLEKQNYDLILMDVQMPVMDGYQATDAIRKMEGDKKHTTIVAMTAHAMEGDREKCINAGMDDYLSKPINPQELFKTIKKWGKPKLEEEFSDNKPLPEEARTAQVIKSQQENPLIDMEAAMARFGNDEDFFREMAEEFLNYAPEQITVLEKAAQSGDADSVQKAAHSIKGAAGNLSAQTIFSLALTIENKGRSKDIKGVSLLIEDLKTGVEELRKFIEKM
jgi:PAS domain S-box-containing protein